MSLTVTLHIYSGRPDPSWNLSFAQSKEFEQLFNQLHIQTPRKALGIPGRLGYRGFTVTDLTTPLCSETRVRDSIVDAGNDQMSLVDSERTMERWLLDSAPSGIVDPVARENVLKEFSNKADHLLKRILTWFALPKAKFACPPLAMDAPSYEPKGWGISAIKTHSHCYDYANNQKKTTGNGSTPGKAHNLSFSSYDCANLIAGATADGLRFFGDATVAPALPLRGQGEGWYVAVATCIKDPTDFHFARQDSDGCWSSKAAGDSVIQFPDIAKPPFAKIYKVCAFMVTDITVAIA